MTREELAWYVCNQINGQGPVSSAEVLDEDSHIISVKTDDDDDLFLVIYHQPRPARRTNN